MFGSRTQVARADVVFESNLGVFRSEMTEAQRVYDRTTGAMSTDALRLAAAQERVNRAVDRYGPESLQAKQATVQLRQEMDRLALAASKADRELDDVGTRTGRTSATMGALRGSVALASASVLGGAGFLYAAKQAVQVASNLEEQIAKNNQVFDSAAPSIIAWSKTTADAFGIAQDKALEAAGTFGNLLNTVDVAPAKAAAMSRSLVQLAADLASFNNASPEDTLAAIRSGLIGEAEPLRRYGVLLSEARVAQRAMADTGKENAKALTDQEKALARYRIILEDTRPAQGDFARTSTSLANQTRRLSANWRDLQANLAKGLTPQLATATG